MKERPIIMTGESVRAILDGRKMQTRRVVKFTDAGHVKEPGKHRRWHPDDPNATLACPYGQPGDRLWCKEVWQHSDWTEDGMPYIRYSADDVVRLIEDVPEEWGDRLSDRWADLSDPANYEIDQRAADRRWRSPIHMPRWASRLTLEISEVRVQRVQEISKADCIAEGMEGLEDVHAGWHQSYAALWDALNAKRGHPWGSNPWAWAVSFRALVPPTGEGVVK